MHINKKEDQQSYLIRKWSRGCLIWIQTFGDKQDQSELINVGYGRIVIIFISSAGGTEEQGDVEIYWVLQYIYRFLNELNNGRNNSNNINNQPSFIPQPALSKICIEQMEEEGGNEEVESQLINKGNVWKIIGDAEEVKGLILNRFIHNN
ncbi:MAG: hypothetical protein EZS28_040882 [Streblomastix strix]|uniref:Uncharacterized protein n=1 Tax=Streblomastix strix TaxID=222440 RepID=A0A5J4U0T9_9EUKA|nr:MAG: hypothetical protein EZS28_040882 [Streblomastix strix]